MILEKTRLDYSEQQHKSLLTFCLFHLLAAVKLRKFDLRHHNVTNTHRNKNILPMLESQSIFVYWV